MGEKDQTCSPIVDIKAEYAARSDALVHKQYALQQDMMKITRHVPSIIVNIKKFVLDNHSWVAKRKKIGRGVNDVQLEIRSSEPETFWCAVLYNHGVGGDYHLGIVLFQSK